MATVLYVDDEDAIRRAVVTWLTRRGHVVHEAAGVASARQVLESQTVDGAFVDLWLGRGRLEQQPRSVAARRTSDLRRDARADRAGEDIASAGELHLSIRRGGAPLRRRADPSRRTRSRGKSASGLDWRSRDLPRLYSRAYPRRHRPSDIQQARSSTLVRARPARPPQAARRRRA